MVRSVSMWCRAALLLVVVSPQALAAQRRVVARDADARMEELAAGVYAIIHQDATTDWATGTMEWPHGNTGVIVGDDGVLVVDATFLPARARADIALIRSVTDKPIRYLVNTHWHGDHTQGNAVYRDEVPGVLILGQELNRDWITTNLARYPAVVGRGISGKHDTLEQLRRLLAAGRDSVGPAFTDAQKASLAENIRRREHEIAEFAKVQIAPPTLLFSEKMVVYLGSRRVEMVNQGRANSPADVTVYLPEERILFTGDIVVLPVPFVGASHPLPWIDVLRRIELMPVAALVPGHGAVQDDMSYVRLVRELFEVTRDRVRPLMLRGILMADAKKEVDLSDMRAKFLKPGDPTIQYHFDEGFKEALVERMYDCVQGYRC